MINLETEADLMKWWEAGNYKPEDWREFWWSERAHALAEIGHHEARLKLLREFVERCRERIEGVTVSESEQCK